MGHCAAAGRSRRGMGARAWATSSFSPPSISRSGPRSRSSATAEELQGLRVVLADADTFERRGLDRPGFLSGLEFRVVADRNGRNVVADHVARVDRRAVRDAAGRGHLAARPQRHASTPCCSIRRCCCRARAAPPAVQPAETRPSGERARRRDQSPRRTAGRRAAGPRRARGPPSSAGRQEPAPNVSSTRPPAPRPPASDAGGVYGPVQRAETLWAIADRLRPDGVSINQMMIAIYQQNPEAFGGNINVLRVGATLAAARVGRFRHVGDDRRQRRGAAADGRVAEPRRAGGQLRLLPPAETRGPPAPVAAPPTPAPRPPPLPRPRRGRTTPDAAAAAAAAEESAACSSSATRSCGSLQDGRARAERRGTRRARSRRSRIPASSSSPSSCSPTKRSPSRRRARAAPAPAPAPRAGRARHRAVARVASHRLARCRRCCGSAWASRALLLTALWFVRRRRQETEDVTGRWEALESEIDDDQATRDATERMRRQAARADDRRRGAARGSAAPGSRASPTSAPRAPRRRRGRRKRFRPDETLSSQTVINLDQADAVAEADFHIAYGLYDQAAELVQKALEAAPDRRDLKLKLLEVYLHVGQQGRVPESRPELCAPRSATPTTRTGTRSSSWASRSAPTSACSRKRRQAAGASTSTSRPATRRSISRSTMRRRLTSGRSARPVSTCDLESSDRATRSRRSRAAKPAARPRLRRRLARHRRAHGGGSRGCAVRADERGRRRPHEPRTSRRTASR